jgi:hypothetical protein
LIFDLKFSVINAGQVEEYPVFSSVKIPDLSFGCDTANHQQQQPQYELPKQPNPNLLD